MLIKIACCQMNVVQDKQKNLDRAEQMVKQATDNGAQIVCLPEMFCCPYDNDCFPHYAEKANGQIVGRLSKIAKNCNCVLVGGSFPEQEGDRIYNSCFVFDCMGQMIGRHRKMHLFDVNIQGGVQFSESDMLSAGQHCTVIDTEYGKIGVAICYDVRFAELFRIMALEGAEIIFVPAAFNMTTGPVHWELSMRSRAVDNQCCIAACSPARDLSANYHAYGHSCIVDAWSNILVQTAEQEDIVYAQIDTEHTARIREQLPILSARRTDLYKCTKTLQQN